MLTLIRKANQRIARIEKKVGFNSAVTQLKNQLSVTPLNMWTQGGRVSTKSNINIQKMQNTIKAVNSFLENPLSTFKGIENAKSKTIETFRINFDITGEEADALSSLFYDKTVNKITNSLPRKYSNYTN